MDSDSHQVTFAPVTRDQARLFAGIGRMLDRRGMSCRFASPSAETTSDIDDDWTTLVSTPQDHGTPINVPESLGAYDAWRYGWTEPDRRSAAEAALRYWRDYLDRHTSRTVIVWNGRDHVFVEAGVLEARTRGIDVLFMELGPLRRAPMTVAVSRGGVNAAAALRRPEMLAEPLTRFEAERFREFRGTYRRGIATRGDVEPYVFLPLQVDDDTQLFYYAPHFADQVEMVRALVAAMPADLPLVLKLHPLAEATRGRDRYAALLRPIDRMAPRESDALELIANSKLVVTTNSSAGVEALMLERPVLVLGEAAYRQRGFTYDYDGKNDLAALIRDASRDCQTDSQTGMRDRYLHELAFHELVHLDRHPLRTALCDEEYERLAIRISEFIDPMSVGSDWTPVFDEIHAMRIGLSQAVAAAVNGAGPAPSLVMSRFAASCLDDRPVARTMLLDEWQNGATLDIGGGTACLLAPDLSPGQRAVIVDRLRSADAGHAVDLTESLSRERCEFHTSRFNCLPRAMRDSLYADSDYWSYYVAQIGPAGDAPPLKAAQADMIRATLIARRPDSILDFGCGGGHILHSLSTLEDRSWNSLVGVDASDGMLNIARHRLSGCRNVRLLSADARHELPFADGEFDAAVTCGALQHVPAEQLEAALSEIQRVTRRTAVHWECFEAHQSARGEHYTNPGTSRAIHDAILRRRGPVKMTVRDLRNVTQQNSLLTRYDLDRPLVTLLTLHAIGAPEPACDSADYRGMFVTERQLDELVRELVRAGYQFSTPSQLRDSDRVLHKTVMLTFDDGYASVFDTARPILDRHGVQAAVCIATDFIGKPFAGATREGVGPALATMTADQICTLRQSGWDVAAHSCSHPVFKTLTPDEVNRELTESKTVLEALLDEPITMFAFPYGEPGVAFGPEHVEAAAQAGFGTILTMQPGFVDPTRSTAATGCGPAEWPRIGIGGDIGADSVLAEITRVHRESNGWPVVAPSTADVLKQRVRRAVKTCIDRGGMRIALYGAGRHTAKLLQSAPLWPLHVLGIIDDDPALTGLTRYGMRIYAPSDIARLNPDALLISSDQYEEAIYRKLAPLEAGGLRVLRLYG